jgi:hypothetical protein
MSVSLVSGSSSPLDQQQLVQQVRSVQSLGSTLSGDTPVTTSSANAIQYIQPPPPPPPRPGPPPARLPDIFPAISSTDTADTSSGATAASATQSLPGVQSTLPALPADSGGNTSAVSGTETSASANGLVTQQLTDVRSHLLTLQSVASLPQIAPQPVIPPTGAVQSRTLLTA